MDILTDWPLQGHNTLGLASTARAFVAPDDPAGLPEVLHWAHTRDLPIIPLGEGSNVVLAGDLEALVLVPRFRGVEVLGSQQGRVTLRVGAGENWHQFVSYCVTHGFYGLENLALIPGAVGAAPVQNIGAYGVELESVLAAVHGVNLASGEAVTLLPGACELGYRDSVFKHALRDRFLITAVDLALSIEPVVTTHYPALADYLASTSEISPRAVYEAVIAIRRSKLPDPAREPNVGSFFKNPVLGEAQAQALLSRFPGMPSWPQAAGEVKIAAAWLIEYCGWKGHRRGGFGVHPQHALVLVNYGDDNGAGLLALAGDIAVSVVDTFGIELSIEPRVYGSARE